jgi:hypothetical protein
VKLDLPLLSPETEAAQHSPSAAKCAVPWFPCLPPDYFVCLLFRELRLEGFSQNRTGESVRQQF